ncbi:uncharacterized protein LOC106963623 [Poecilia latipinna]|uniref:uncharacterized protein LOC106905414 n=1 Tax=Poecilia mexicana TaxID=48701 RepID=UPI00072E0925|nr:PREDICTED: uncharacterized protein LOC106905414 [Poecilia mexicana]XP_014914129.1 PREDICTED: uncharacterized protein LOC106963623 [Poecilia latipinna]
MSSLSLFVSSAPDRGVQTILPIEVNVTQKSYWAEKNDNLTLDFTFTPKLECSHNLWLVSCDWLKNDTISCYKLLYEYIELDGETVSEFQDEKFSGRVVFDKDVLRKGRIRLHVSRLKVEDSGVYVCKLNIGHCKGSDTSKLNVTDSHPFELPATVSPSSEDRGRTGLPFVAAAAAAAVTILIICYIIYRKKTNSERQPLRSRQAESSCFVLS